MKKKTYTFDINDITYSVKIKKTLIVDYIPYQQPSLMGRVTYTSSNAPFGAQDNAQAHDELLYFDSLVFSKLKFDFTIETMPHSGLRAKPIPGQNEEVIDLVPCFDPSVIRVAQARRAVHVPPIITETIKMCIKNYYHEFLSTLK